AGETLHIRSLGTQRIQPCFRSFRLRGCLLKGRSPMKQVTEFQAKQLSAQEYILALHEPEDRVAVLLVNRRRGQSLQRIASAETVAAPEFQQWLAYRNHT